MIRLIAALATLAAVTAPAAAQDFAALQHPRLKAQAVVTGDLVRVGDLVTHAGIIAEVPIFRAPDLGTTGSVPASAVVEAVRQHALVGLDTAGIQNVEVTRASRTITTQEIEDCVAQALVAKFSLGAPADVDLTFDEGLQPVQVEPDAIGAPDVTRIDYDARSGRFHATLRMPAGQSARTPLHLSGRAAATVEVAMVAHAVERGAILKDADIVLERRPRARVGHGVITDRAEAIGLAARNTLQPGQPLRAAQLMKPELIKRNEQVSLIYEVPGITLTVRGKAKEGGALGDVIAVLNEQSKRVLQGIVIGPGQVSINMPTRQIAARK
jgi:flagella basal body P-ring formation protein FlgA